MNNDGNNGDLRRALREATFTDAIGETRTVHQLKGKRWSLRQEATTPSLALNRAVGPLMGAKIRAAREARGMSMAELAQAAGLVDAKPKHRIYAIECGKRQECIRFGTLYALAIALGVSPADLIPSAVEAADAAGVDMGVATSLMVGRNAA